MLRALIGAAAVTALLALAVGVAIPVLIHRNLTVEEVERRGSEIAGRRVTVESVGIAFVPALRIRAEGVAVEGGGSADAVEVEIALLPLLRRRVEPSELHLRGTRLLLERAPGGGLRVRLFHPPGRDPAAPRSGFPALPALEASDGEIVLVEADGSPSGGPVLRIREFEQGRLRHDGHTPFLLEIAVEPGARGQLGIGALELEGSLELGREEVHVRAGHFEGSDLLARGLRIPRFAGRFEYVEGAAAVESASFEGYGGRVDLAGSLRPGRPGRFQGRFELAPVDVDAALSDWRGTTVEHDYGVLSGQGDLDLWLRGQDRGTGNGTLEIRGGTLPAGSIFSALLGGIGKLTGNVFSLGRAVAPRRSRVESLTAGWRLGDDRLHSTDFVLTTDDYRYAAAGSVGLDQTLALTGELQLTSHGLQRMVAMAALPLPASTSVIPEIPVDVGGRLSKVHVTARATALPSAAKSTLAGLVRGGGGVVKGAAETGGTVVKGAAKGGKKIVDKVLGR